MSKQVLPTPSAPPVRRPYSPAVRAGDWLILSGQVGWSTTERDWVKGAGAQTETILRNLEAILGDCGATLADIAKTTVYLTDVADFDAMNDAYARVFGGEWPARTTVVVADLPGDGVVEIEAWAHAPEPREAP